MMITPPPFFLRLSFLLLFLLGLAVSPSISAAPEPPQKGTAEVKFGGTTWVIEYDSRKDDGTLVSAKGRNYGDPQDVPQITIFYAGECKVEKDRLELGKFFEVAKGASRSNSIDPETRAIIKANGSYAFVGGRVRTQIVEQ
jgi:hypothetical protein